MTATAHALREALLLVLVLAAPPLVAVFGVGLASGVLQAVTQVRERSLSTVPRHRGGAGGAGAGGAVDRDAARGVHARGAGGGAGARAVVTRRRAATAWSGGGAHGAAGAGGGAVRARVGGARDRGGAADGDGGAVRDGAAGGGDGGAAGGAGGRPVARAGGGAAVRRGRGGRRARRRGRASVAGAAAAGTRGPLADAYRLFALALFAAADGPRLVAVAAGKSYVAWPIGHAPSASRGRRRRRARWSATAVSAGGAGAGGDAGGRAGARARRAGAAGAGARRRRGAAARARGAAGRGRGGLRRRAHALGADDDAPPPTCRWRREPSRCSEDARSLPAWSCCSLRGRRRTPTARWVFPDEDDPKLARAGEVHAPGGTRATTCRASSSPTGASGRRRPTAATCRSTSPSSTSTRSSRFVRFGLDGEFGVRRRHVRAVVLHHRRVARACSGRCA